MSKKDRNEQPDLGSPRVNSRSPPMHPKTRCVSRRHRESMQGWGGTSGRSSKNGRRGLWMWSAASSLHGRVMTSTYATSLAKQWLNPSELRSGCSFRYCFYIFCNISVPNNSEITKQRRPDSLRNASWHKSEPAIWVVNIFVNIENKPTYLRFGSIFYIEEWHSYWQVGTGYMASKIRTCARSLNTMSMVTPHYAGCEPR